MEPRCGQETKTPVVEQGKFRQFEQYVASIYEHLGFSVTANVLLSGQQIDVLAQRIVSGLGRTRLIVECKYRSKGNVSNQELYDFATVFSAISQANNLDAAVMVTNSGFSAEAMQFAAQIGRIRLLTTSELVKSIFHAGQALRPTFNTTNAAKSLLRSYTSSAFHRTNASTKPFPT